MRVKQNNIFNEHHNETIMILVTRNYFHTLYEL